MECDIFLNIFLRRYDVKFVARFLEVYLSFGMPRISMKKKFFEKTRFFIFESFLVGIFVDTSKNTTENARQIAMKKKPKTFITCRKQMNAFRALHMFPCIFIVMSH